MNEAERVAPFIEIFDPLPLSSSIDTESAHGNRIDRERRRSSRRAMLLLCGGTARFGRDDGRYNALAALHELVLSLSAKVAALEAQLLAGACGCLNVTATDENTCRVQPADGGAFLDLAIVPP